MICVIITRRIFTFFSNMNHSNSNVNKVFLVGEISRQPRWHRNGQAGSALCFTLITKESYEKNGATIEQAEEHAIKIAENRLQGELKLGQLIHIEGKLQTSVRVDEQLVKRYKTEVIGMRIQVLR